MGKGGCGAFSELQLGYQVLIIFTSVIGPALIIAGIVLMGMEGAIGRTREDLVDTYNTAALLFADHAADFDRVQFSYNGVPFSRSNKQLQLNDTGDFEPYKQIAHVISGIPVDNVTLATFQVFSDYPSAGQILDFGSTSESNTFTSTGFDLGCVVEGECDNYQGEQLTACQNTILCPKACADIKGVWDADHQYCTTTHYLNSLCFKISQPTHLAWAADPSFGDVGCYYKGKEAAESVGNLDPAINTWTPALYGPKQPTEITITIRHANDPYIFASFATVGTFNFGPTFLYRLTPGIILLAVGAGCVILFAVGDFFLVRYLLSSGRGQKRKFREGGLESRSLVGLQPQKPELPGGSALPHSAPHHPPKTHIIDIYVASQA